MKDEEILNKTQHSEITYTIIPSEVNDLLNDLLNILQGSDKDGIMD